MLWPSDFVSHLLLIKAACAILKENIGDFVVFITGIVWQGTRRIHIRGRGTMNDWLQGKSHLSWKSWRSFGIHFLLASWENWSDAPENARSAPNIFRVPGVHGTV